MDRFVKRLRLHADPSPTSSSVEQRQYSTATSAVVVADVHVHATEGWYVNYVFSFTLLFNNFPHGFYRAIHVVPSLQMGTGKMARESCLSACVCLSACGRAPPGAIACAVRVTILGFSTCHRCNGSMAAVRKHGRRGATAPSI